MYWTLPFFALTIRVKLEIGGVNMEYIKVAQVSEIAVGGKKKISLDKREILLANIDGLFYAIDNKCPHMGGSLFDGHLEANVISCPRHGSAFDIRTGKNIHDAKLLFIKMKVNDAHSLPVKVEETDIYIGIE